jgi:hypothetical protein
MGLMEVLMQTHSASAVSLALVCLAGLWLLTVMHIAGAVLLQVHGLTALIWLTGTWLDFFPNPSKPFTIPIHTQ